VKLPDSSPREAHILIVDDDPNTVLVLASVLKGLGRVYLSTRPGEAVSLALRVVPDLVLLDVEMPDADGFTVLKELRTHAPLDDTLILFVTSHSAPEIEARALSAGAIDFVHKPVHADIVRARVRNYLALKQQGDTLALRVKELQAASEHVRELQGIIPICMHCKRIRNETKIWKRSRRTSRRTRKRSSATRSAPNVSMRITPTLSELLTLT
jgi:PleD family two-component response regulator